MGASTHLPTAMKSTRYNLAILLVLGALSAAPASAQNGDALLGRIRARYTGLRSLQAEFTQSMTNAYGGREQFSGTLLTQGNAYRVEAGQQRFVTDGRTTWLHDLTKNQVVVNRYVEDATAFSPQSFLTRYTSRYRVTRVASSGSGAARTYTLTLVPRSNAEMFDQVLLTMRDRDNTVTDLQMRDVNGTQIRYSLRNVRFNPAVPAGSFAYRIPRGAEVVDLRS